MRSGFWFERASEKIVERLVAGNVRVGSLGHVNLVALNKPADDAGGQCARLSAGQFAGQRSERLFGKQVLGQDSKAIGHGDFARIKGPQL